MLPCVRDNKHHGCSLQQITERDIDERDIISFTIMWNDVRGLWWYCSKRHRCLMASFRRTLEKMLEYGLLADISLFDQIIFKILQFLLERYLVGQWMVIFYSGVNKWSLEHCISSCDNQSVCENECVNEFKCQVTS